VILIRPASANCGLTEQAACLIWRGQRIDHENGGHDDLINAVAGVAREFANQKALLDYAERNALVYAWERSPAFTRRQRVLSPEQYEIVDVRTSRGINRALLFSQAILLAEWEANAPLREAMAIKRERWRVKRAEERHAAAARAAKRRST
jgi:hypothetical protein